MIRLMDAWMHHGLLIDACMDGSCSADGGMNLPWSVDGCMGWVMVFWGMHKLIMVCWLICGWIMVSWWIMEWSWFADVCVDLHDLLYRRVLWWNHNLLICSQMHNHMVTRDRLHWQKKIISKIRTRVKK